MSDRASHDSDISVESTGAQSDTESASVGDTETDTVSLSDSDCVAGIEDMTVVDSGSTAGLDAGAGCEGSKCSPLSEFTPPRTGRSGDCEAIKNGHEFAFSMSPSKRKPTSLSSVSTKSPTCSSPARGLQNVYYFEVALTSSPLGFLRGLQCKDYAKQKQRYRRRFHHRQCILTLQPKLILIASSTRIITKLLHNRCRVA